MGSGVLSGCALRRCSGGPYLDPYLEIWGSGPPPMLKTHILTMSQVLSTLLHNVYPHYGPIWAPFGALFGPHLGTPFGDPRTTTYIPKPLYSPLGVYQDTLREHLLEGSIWVPKGVPKEDQIRGARVYPKLYFCIPSGYPSGTLFRALRSTFCRPSGALLRRSTRA